jgi:hypothetical protein
LRHTDIIDYAALSVKFSFLNCLHFCKTFCNIYAVILLHSIQSVKHAERLHPCF